LIPSLFVGTRLISPTQGFFFFFFPFPPPAHFCDVAKVQTGDYPEEDLAKLIVSSFYRIFDVAEVVIIYQKI
jgi:hypothetical protein